VALVQIEVRKRCLASSTPSLPAKDSGEVRLRDSALTSAIRRSTAEDAPLLSPIR
jgi:hypothetical protein